MLTKIYRIVANASTVKNDKELLKIEKFINERYCSNKEISKTFIMVNVYNEDHANEIVKFLSEKGYY